jgi:hypothetical protein
MLHPVVVHEGNTGAERRRASIPSLIERWSTAPLALVIPLLTPADRLASVTSLPG